MLARRYVVSIVVMAVIGGVGACTRTDTADTAGGQPSAQIQNAENVLAGLVPNNVADKFQLDLAEHIEQFIVDCMAAYDFTYRPKDPHSLVDVETDTDFASVDYARTYGFGVTAFPHLADTRDPNANYLDALDYGHRSSYEQQLSSCADSAAQLAKQQNGIIEAERRFSRTDKLVQVDPHYRAAQKEWTRCAAASGYSKPSRLDLIRDFETERDVII
jgi:hypothetical protein